MGGSSRPPAGIGFRIRRAGAARKRRCLRNAAITRWTESPPGHAWHRQTERAARASQAPFPTRKPEGAAKRGFRGRPSRSVAGARPARKPRVYRLRAERLPLPRRSRSPCRRRSPSRLPRRRRGLQQAPLAAAGAKRRFPWAERRLGTRPTTAGCAF